MKACRPNWRRQLGRWLAVAAGIVLMDVLAPAPVVAQGTAQQRAACESEARWLCSNYIPDENAIKACLLRNLKALSPACRAVFRGGSKRRR
jgi:hypothetical protein